MKQYLKETLPLLLAMALILAFAVFDFFHANAACMPLEWVMRNGLTDEQISSILSKDASTTIRLNANMWRNVEFNTHRYNNVTNWLAVIGETNEFARLVVPLTATNEILTAENASLCAANTRLTNERDYYYNAYTNATAEVASLTTKITSEIAFLEDMKTLCDQLAAKYPAQYEEIMAIKAQFQSRIDYLTANCEASSDKNGEASSNETTQTIVY